VRQIAAIAKMLMVAAPDIVFEAMCPLMPFRMPCLSRAPLGFVLLVAVFARPGFRSFVDREILADAYSDFAHNLVSVEPVRRHLIIYYVFVNQILII
jgi:hypothetical protein